MIDSKMFYRAVEFCKKHISCFECPMQVRMGFGCKASLYNIANQEDPAAEIAELRKTLERYATYRKTWREWINEAENDSAELDRRLMEYARYTIQHPTIHGMPDVLMPAGWRTQDGSGSIEPEGDEHVPEV